MIKLITFFSTGIPALFTLIFSFFARKYSTAIAAIIAVGIMLTVFIGCINLILNTVIATIAVPNWLLVGLGMFIPGNFAAILSALVSAKICRAAFDYAYKKADIVVKAN